MLNLKKIVIGMGLLSILATAGFSEDYELNKEFCQNHKIINKESYNNKNWCSASKEKQSVEQDGFNEIFNSKYGEMHPNYLPNFLQWNWGKVYNNMNEFLCYMKSNNKNATEEIRKFIVANFKDGTWKNDNRDIKTLIINNSMNLFIERDESFGERGSFYLTQFFADATIMQNNATYSPFIKYILNKNYKRAEAYVKSINEESGINEVFSEIENECQKLK